VSAVCTEARLPDVLEDARERCGVTDREFWFPRAWPNHLHWFNPAVHVGRRMWSAACEEAADADAIRWSDERDGGSYAETLVRAMRFQAASPKPFGALTIIETMKTLKSRIREITCPSRRRSIAVGLAASAALALAMVAAPAQGEDSDPKKAAVAAMEKWLAGIDAGHYAESWRDASKSFREAVTEGQWEGASKAVRGPLGAFKSRTLASALHQTEVPRPGGEPLEGNFVIAQFNASFANLEYAVETVTFEKGSDGVWRAAGYYVMPGPGSGFRQGGGGV
jgi:hypothetical protein